MVKEMLCVICNPFCQAEHFLSHSRCRSQSPDTQAALWWYINRMEQIIWKTFGLLCIICNPFCQAQPEVHESTVMLLGDTFTKEAFKIIERNGAWTQRVFTSPNLLQRLTLGTHAPLAASGRRLGAVGAQDLAEFVGRRLAGESYGCAFSDGKCALNRTQAHPTDSNQLVKGIMERQLNCLDFTTKSTCTDRPKCMWSPDHMLCDGMISPEESQFLMATAFSPETCGWFGLSYNAALTCALDSDCSSANCMSGDAAVIKNGQCTSQRVCAMNPNRVFETLCNGQSQESLVSGCQDVDCVTKKCPAFGPVFDALQSAMESGQNIQDPSVLQRAQESSIPVACGIREVLGKTRDCNSRTQGTCTGDCMWEESQACESPTGAPQTSSACGLGNMAATDLFARSSNNAAIHDWSKLTHAIAECPAQKTEKACSQYPRPDYEVSGARGLA